jgi:hypothetical protein
VSDHQQFQGAVERLQIQDHVSSQRYRHLCLLSKKISSLFMEL